MSAPRLVSRNCRRSRASNRSHMIETAIEDATMSDTFALAELARQVRTDTRRMLAAAKPEWLTWAPAGTSNHILWHAGHAVWLLDVLGIELLTGRNELPAGWAETFGMNCWPVQETRTWPSPSELDSALSRQLDRFVQL